MDFCLHCDEPAPFPLFSENDGEKKSPFCCEGCLSVYGVLGTLGLADYYRIKEEGEILKPRSPVFKSNSEFTYLDEPAFIAEYAHSEKKGEIALDFYLEGVHCLACLWLIEKLPEINPSILSSKLDLEKSVATVRMEESAKVSEVAKLFNNLGYRPHVLKNNQELKALRSKEERSQLLRIGVAGAAAGNIMLYAVSLYGGAQGEHASFFNLLTVLFAIPVLTYSAYPFYKNAWMGLKNRSLSIDVPISLSLIFGAILGVTDLLSGRNENYFDSLTTLVFLLLLSRYFLQKVQQRGLAASDLNFFYQNETVRKIENGQTVEIHPDFIRPGETLLISPDEFFPVDGEVIAGESEVDNSLLTGESESIKVSLGSQVFSGTRNIGGEVRISACSGSRDSRLGKMLKNVESGWGLRSSIVTISQRVSEYFTLTVIFLSVALFIFVLQSSGPEAAMERAVVLLIVTCPCALALSIPLSFTRALRLAAQNGIVIKNDETIERLEKAKHLFLDKTGTITFGQIKVKDFTTELPLRELGSLLVSLERGSHHPVGRALFELGQNLDGQFLDVLERKELTGIGVSGEINGAWFEIRSQKVFKDGKIVASFKLQDLLRADSAKEVRKLRTLGLLPMVLSGDLSETVKSISMGAGFQQGEFRGELSPEMKAQLIDSQSCSIMVGDGANDALAMSRAGVGVAVFGAMDISLRSADVYLTTPGLSSLSKLIVLSRETMRVIRRNLILSLSYNSISVALAFAGVISPLSAAIIMPLSSLTVLVSSSWGTKEMRSLWKS